jgi:hypothetical protein
MSFSSVSRALSRPCLSFVFGSSVVALHGQIASTPAAPSAPTQLNPYIVQGRDTDLVGTAVSASQGIVGANELDARPFLRRGELLEVIPGVVITQHSGGGKANQYFLRGFNLDHGTDFSVNVDGMPVNMRTHAHGQGYADLNFLIPEMVRQVDYNKGPFFTAVGDFSAAGSAEFRQFDLLPENFASLTFGENRFVRFVTGATRRGANQDATTGAIEVSHEDGPWQLEENFERVNGFVRHHWTRDAASYRVTAMAFQAKWRATDQIPLRAVESGRLDRFGNTDDTNGGKTERVSLSFDGTWRDANATTRLNAYAIHYRLNLYSNFTYFLDSPADGDQFNQRDRRIVAGGALTRSWSAQSGGAKSETAAGVQVRSDFIRELGLHRTARRARLSTVRDDDVDEASVGAFLQNETRWNDWLRSETGVRWDGYRFNVSSDDPRNSGDTLDQIVSPKLGFAFGPWARTELYANAGFGFHSNDARGTTIRIDPADGVTQVDRVTPLARSRGAELGVRTAAVPGLVSSLSLWALDLDSELVFVGDAGGTEPTGRTRRYGIELANFWRPRRWLALEGDVALTHARYREDAGDGKRIANSIATVVTAGASLGRTEGWFGGARLRYFGPQPLIEDNSERAPSSTTINARLGWRAKAWEFSVDILNVLDRENYDIAYAYASRLPGEPVDGFDDLHFHPAEPRTVRVTITRRF